MTLPQSRIEGCAASAESDYLFQVNNQVPTMQTVHLPSDLQHEIFVLYRTCLRRRIAERRLQHTRRRRMIRQMQSLFEFACGRYDVVLHVLAL